jgi:hypothetical protein
MPSERPSDIKTPEELERNLVDHVDRRRAMGEPIDEPETEPQVDPYKMPSGFWAKIPWAFRMVWKAIKEAFGPKEVTGPRAEEHKAEAVADYWRRNPDATPQPPLAQRVPGQAPLAQQRRRVPAQPLYQGQPLAQYPGQPLYQGQAQASVAVVDQDGARVAHMNGSGVIEMQGRGGYVRVVNGAVGVPGAGYAQVPQYAQQMVDAGVQMANAGVQFANGIRQWAIDAQRNPQYAWGHVGYAEMQRNYAVQELGNARREFDNAVRELGNARREFDNASQVARRDRRHEDRARQWGDYARQCESKVQQWGDYARQCEGVAQQWGDCAGQWRAHAIQSGIQPAQRGEQFGPLYGRGGSYFGVQVLGAGNVFFNERQIAPEAHFQQPPAQAERRQAPVPQEGLVDGRVADRPASQPVAQQGRRAVPAQGGQQPPAQAERRQAPAPRPEGDGQVVRQQGIGGSHQPVDGASRYSQPGETRHDGTSQQPGETDPRKVAFGQAGGQRGQVVGGGSCPQPGVTVTGALAQQPGAFRPS